MVTYRDMVTQRDNRGVFPERNPRTPPVSACSLSPMCPDGYGP